MAHLAAAAPERLPPMTLNCSQGGHWLFGSGCCGEVYLRLAIIIYEASVS